MSHNRTTAKTQFEPTFAPSHGKEGDPEVFREIFATGDTRSIFQFESKGMREYLQKMRPSEFNDIVAMNALYRPGPMKLIPDYIARKHGEEEVRYLGDSIHDRVKGDVAGVLDETYGIMVFQEQVMKVAQILAGFTLGQADILRRACGKKKRKLLMKQQQKFVQGCVQEGYGREVGEEVFELIEEFADYAFNKSHAAAYSAIAYASAYLKCHYPTSFFAAAVEHEGDEEDRAKLILNAEQEDVKVLPPSINDSWAPFTPEPEKSAVRFGLGGIKHVGSEADSIIEEREQNGRYKGLKDLCLRAIPNSQALKNLIMAGALDAFGPSRSTMYEAAESYLDYARKMRDVRRGKRKSKPEKPHPRQVKEWPRKMRFQQEMEVAGIFTVTYPLDAYEPFLEHLDRADFYRNGRNGRQHYRLFCGTITNVNEATTRNDNPMWWVTFLGQNEAHELPMFEWKHKRFGAFLEKGETLVFVGKEGTGQYEGSYNIDACYPLDRAMEEWAQVLKLTPVSKKKARRFLAKAQSSEEGPCSIWIEGEGRTVEAGGLSVSLTENLLRDAEKAGLVDVF